MPLPYTEMIAAIQRSANEARRILSTGSEVQNSHCLVNWILHKSYQFSEYQDVLLKLKSDVELKDPTLRLRVEDMMLDLLNSYQRSVDELIRLRDLVNHPTESDFMRGSECFNYLSDSVSEKLNKEIKKDYATS